MKLIVLIAPSGYGKTTYANKIATEREICCADDYHMIDGKYQWKPENLGRAHSQCQKKCQELMSNGANLIVIANTNTTIKEFRPYVEMANQYGYSVEFTKPRYYLFIDELFQRNVHSVPKESIQRMCDRVVCNRDIATFMDKDFPSVNYSFEKFDNVNP